MSARSDLVDIAGELRREIEIVAAEIEAGRLVTNRWLTRALPWNGLPRAMRLLYVAQRGECSLCYGLMPLRANGNEPEVATFDHVIPRSCGGGRGRNLLLAHRGCNQARGNAEPSELQRVFAETVYDRLASYRTSEGLCGSFASRTASASTQPACIR